MAGTPLLGLGGGRGRVVVAGECFLLGGSAEKSSGKESVLRREEGPRVSLQGWKLPRHLPEHGRLPLTAEARHPCGRLLKDLGRLASEGVSAAAFRVTSGQ